MIYINIFIYAIYFSELKSEADKIIILNTEFVMYLVYNLLVPNLPLQCDHSGNKMCLILLSIYSWCIFLNLGTYKHDSDIIYILCSRKERFQYILIAVVSAQLRYLSMFGRRLVII